MKVHIFFKSSKEFNAVVRSGKGSGYLNSGYPKRYTLDMVKADHGRDFHPLADHIIKL